MEPSSPKRYETSLGSIHSVNCVGRYSEMFDSPVTFAASFTTGSSLRPLILIHRYALPLLGLLGSQCSRYLSVNSSSIRFLNGFVNCAGRCLVARRLDRNPHPHSISSRMAASGNRCLYYVLRCVFRELGMKGAHFFLNS